MIGIILMVTMGTGGEFVNALSGLIYAGVLPFSILGSVVLYRRRQGRSMPPEPRTRQAITEEMMTAGAVQRGQA